MQRMYSISAARIVANSHLYTNGAAVKMWVSADPVHSQAPGYPNEELYTRNILTRVAERCQTLLNIGLKQCTAVMRCSKSRAVATEKAATAPHRVRTAVLRQHSGHSRVMSAATIGQPRRPVACSGRDQRWGRGYGLVWNVIGLRLGKHRRSRNTCNVKSGRFPVHLGLDHALRRR